MSFAPLKSGCSSCAIFAAAKIDIRRWGEETKRCEACIKAEEDEREKARMRLIDDRNRKALDQLRRSSKPPFIAPIK